MLYVCCTCVVRVLYDVVRTLYVEHFKTATKTPTQNYPRSQPHHHEDAACMLSASKPPPYNSPRTPSTQNTNI